MMKNCQAPLQSGLQTIWAAEKAFSGMLKMELMSEVGAEEKQTLIKIIFEKPTHLS